MDLTPERVRDVVSREIAEIADGTIVVRAIGVSAGRPPIAVVKIAVSSAVHSHPDRICAGRDRAVAVLAALGPDVAFEAMPWSGVLVRDAAVALAPLRVLRIAVVDDSAVHAIMSQEELASRRETPARVAACQQRVELAASLLGVTVYLHPPWGALDPARAAFASGRVD